MSVASQWGSTEDLALRQEAERFARLRANLGLSPTTSDDPNDAAGALRVQTDWEAPGGGTQHAADIGQESWSPADGDRSPDEHVEVHFAVAAEQVAERHVVARALSFRPFSRGLILGAICALVLAGIQARTQETVSSGLPSVIVDEPAAQVASLQVPTQEEVNSIPDPAQEAVHSVPDPGAEGLLILTASNGGLSEAATSGPLGGTLLSELIEYKYRPHAARQFLRFSVPSVQKGQALEPLPVFIGRPEIDLASLHAQLSPAEPPMPPVLFAIDERQPIHLNTTGLRSEQRSRCSEPRPRASADQSMSFGQFASNLVSDLGELGGCLF